MTTRTADFDDEDLLRQLGWVRRLAIELVREPAAADDVTQDVARIALERRAQFEGDERGLRAWLAAVVRRVVIDRRRSDQARRAREHRVARPEGDESALSIESRSERARVLAEVVQSLPDPYRATVLHRYFDELSIADVAARTGVDEPTARKRLSRAHALLRERLDRRGEGEPGAWLASLVGVGIDHAVRDGVTSGTAAKTAVATGVGLMGTKLVIGAVVCAAVVAVLVLRNDSQVVEPTPVVAATLEIPVLSRDEFLAPIESVGAGESARKPTNQAAMATATKAVEIASAETKLFVRVVDFDGKSVTDGVLAIWRSRTPSMNPWVQTFDSVRIAGDVTEVPFPSETQSAMISASGTGQTPSAPYFADRIAMNEHREITLTIGGPLTGRSITGRVLVDGLQSVPPGLSVDVRTEHGVLAGARVNFVDATWAADNLPSEWLTFVAKSDTTVPARCTPTAAELANGRFDLELSRGRTLIVRLLDRLSGTTIPNAPLAIATSVAVDERTSEGSMRPLRTDANGTVRVSGIPRFGSVAIHPDLDPVVRAVPFRDGRTMNSIWPTAAWHRQSLRESDPDPLEIELRVDIPQPGATVFGVLARAERARGEDVQVLAVELSTVDAHGDMHQVVQLDTEGRWTLPTYWPSRYRVWLQEKVSRAQLTEPIEIAIDTGGEHGPIDLVKRVGTPFELEIVGVPSGGELSIYVMEKGRRGRSENLEARDGFCIHTLELSDAGYVTVSWNGPVEGDSEGNQISRNVAVDPERASRLHVDFEGDSLVEVEFAPNGEPLPSEAMLHFIRMGTADVPSARVGRMATAGAVLTDVALSPGRWIWGCSVRGANVAGWGAFDIGPETRRVRLAPKFASVPLADVPNGIVLEEADGVDFRAVIPDSKARTIHMSSPGDVLVREDARWSPVP